MKDNKDWTIAVAKHEKQKEIKIQSIGIVPKGGGFAKWQYWCKVGNAKSKRISEKKWFDLYDQNATVLPPIYKELV